MSCDRTAAKSLPKCSIIGTSRGKGAILIECLYCPQDRAGTDVQTHRKATKAPLTGNRSTKPPPAVLFQSTLSRACPPFKLPFISVVGVYIVPRTSPASSSAVHPRFRLPLACGGPPNCGARGAAGCGTAAPSASARRGAHTRRSARRRRLRRRRRAAAVCVHCQQE